MLPFLQQGQIQGSQSDHASQKQWWIQDFMGVHQWIQGGGGGKRVNCLPPNPRFLPIFFKKTICFSRFYVSMPPEPSACIRPCGALWYFVELEPLAPLYPPLPKVPRANFSRFRSIFFANSFSRFCQVQPPKLCPWIRLCLENGLVYISLGLLIIILVLYATGFTFVRATVGVR